MTLSASISSYNSTHTNLGSVIYCTFFRPTTRYHCALPFQAVSTIIAVGTSHGIVLIFGEQQFLETVLKLPLINGFEYTVWYNQDVSCKTILTALAIFGGKRQLPPIMPPKIKLSAAIADEFLCH
jgi:hypothetical protein